MNSIETIYFFNYCFLIKCLIAISTRCGTIVAVRLELFSTISTFFNDSFPFWKPWVIYRNCTRSGTIILASMLIRIMSIKCITAIWITTDESFSILFWLTLTFYWTKCFPAMFFWLVYSGCAPKNYLVSYSTLSSMQFHWSGWPVPPRRPLAPHASALAVCATSRSIVRIPPCILSQNNLVWRQLNA